MDTLQSEALRYMGVPHEQEPDAQTKQKLHQVMEQLQAASNFTFTQKELPAVITGEQLRLPGLMISSAALSAHLKGCARVLLFAATLGAAVDRLMLRLSKSDITGAMMLQACAAALLEHCADNAQADIARQYAQSFVLRPRFSPGYRDFSLLHQRDILTALEAGKRIGLSCTGNHMLTPTKSITAIMGLLPADEAGSMDKSCAANSAATRCRYCDMHDCAFKEEEKET